MRVAGNWEIMGEKGMSWEGGGASKTNLFSFPLYTVIGLTIITM